jgi:thiol-disulfide isomerase/thioredoxin
MIGLELKIGGVIMAHFVFAAVALFSLVGTLQGDGNPKKQDKSSKDTPSAAEFKAIMADMEKLESSIEKALGEAKTEKDQKLVMENYQTNLQKMAVRFLDLAKKYPKEKTAFDALQFAIGYAGPTPTGEKATEVMLADHFDRIDNRYIRRLAASDSPAAGKLLRGVIQKSTDRKIQAQAMLSLAKHLVTLADGDDVKAADAAKLNKEAESVLTELASEKYADATTSSGDEIKKLLFQLRNLSVGSTAPDIIGEDADGKKLKLSDYRGKVVVLDFWASWCKPCMAMVPHERELVKRLKDKPFAFLGVNLDKDKDTQKKTEQENDMTWPSFFDGRTGPISEKWNIESIPAIYVLDAKGVIRYKGVRGKDMDEAVDTLLKETK